MKKIILILALLMPVFTYSQETENKDQTTYEKFTSSIGYIVKYYNYTLPNLPSTYDLASVVVRKVISEGDESLCFLRIEFTRYEGSTQSAFIAENDLVEMKKALEELISLSASDGTGDADYLENKFRIKDGSCIGYYIAKNKSGDKKPTWYFDINGRNNGTLYFSSPDALLNCFSEAIAKIEAIK